MSLLQAYLKGDEAVLSQHCTPGCVQRLSGIIQAEWVAAVGCLPNVHAIMSKLLFLLGIQDLHSFCAACPMHD